MFDVFCSDRALLHSEAEKVPAIAAPRHIILDITPPPLTLFPLSAGVLRAIPTANC